MAILTKFLQLLKPERNDYVDVEKHLSENYDKIDTKMEELSNSNDKKLDKGAVSTEYDTAKKIEDKIKGINEKFKNFCPFPVNSLYLSLGSENPSSLWLGTTWQKQENRFLLGAGSGKYDAGTMGGNSSVSLGINNMPRHRHKVDSTSASISPHTHTFEIRMDADEGAEGPYYGTPGNGHFGAVRTSNPTSSAGGGSTSTFAPYTDYQGNGSAFSIMPPYIAVNIWKRTS